MDSSNREGDNSEEVEGIVPSQPNYVSRTDVPGDEDNPHSTVTRTITLSPNDIYPVNSSPKGYIQVINIVKWDNNVQEERVESEKDVEAIKNVFPKYGYEVSVAENLDKKQFENCVKTFCNDERHKNVDSAILIIMSHGCQPETPGRLRSFYSQSLDILTKDNQRVSSDWVKEQFTSVNCPALATKPKIIIFAACRGEDRDYGFAVLKHVVVPNAGPIKLVPNITNLLMVFPCLPGYVSHRDNIGTWMIQEFISVLEKRWREKDLETMLEEVSRKLKDRHKIVGEYQVVNHTSFGFDKKFFFNQIPAARQNPSA